MTRIRIKGFMKRTLLADSAARSVGRYANKAFHAMGKESRKEAERTTKMIGIAELQQRILFRHARSDYELRRLSRRISSLGEWMSTDKKPGVGKEVLWWVIDVLLFFWGLLWGFLEPIITMFLFGLARVVLTVVIYTVFVYVLYLIFTA